MNQNPQFDKHFGNALPPAIIILVFIWLFYWADSLFLFQFYKLGVLPKSIEGLQGILFMPLVHSTENFNHIINNSVPIFLLTLFLFYFYKEIAHLKFFCSVGFLQGSACGGLPRIKEPIILG